MANRLHSQLTTLASSFIASVLAAVRTSSFDELRTVGAHSQPAARRASASPEASSPPSRGRRGRKGAGGRRLKRRSPEDIALSLEGIVDLLKKNSDGLRAEQIRGELGMQAKEMPRILGEGLSKRLLRRKGRKRSTTYFAS